MTFLRSSNLHENDLLISYLYVDCHKSLNFVCVNYERKENILSSNHYIELDVRSNKMLPDTPNFFFNFFFQRNCKICFVWHSICLLSAVYCLLLIFTDYCYLRMCEQGFKSSNTPFR